MPTSTSEGRKVAVRSQIVVVSVVAVTVSVIASTTAQTDEGARELPRWWKVTAFHHRTRPDGTDSATDKSVIGTLRSSGFSRDAAAYAIIRLPCAYYSAPNRPIIIFRLGSVERSRTVVIPPREICG